MKKLLLSFIPLFLLILFATSAYSQCQANFTWEQIPGTLQIHFNNTSTSEFDITSNFWDFGDGDEGDAENPTHTYDAPGTYLVCLTIETANDCVDDICIEVTVQEISSDCNAAFNWEQFDNSLQVHFNNNSTSEHDIISYQWNFGDGHEGDGENPNHTYDQPGTYLVCLIITDAEGCVSDVCHEVTVVAIQSDCNAAFNWEQFDNSYQVHFNNQSTSEHDIISYQWNFGDGHSGDGENPNHTYDEPGTYLVCLIIEDNVGCVSDVCHEVTVEGIASECDAEFSWEQFEGTLEVDFTNLSTSDHDIVSYQWNFGDDHNSDGQNPSHTYEEPGTYLVCLIITNEAGCVSDVCHEVTVQELEGDCHASFNWEQVENSLEIYFHSTSTSEHDIISFQWDFGDGHEGEGPNPHHTYEEPGVYVVCLRIEDNTGCVSEICHEVTVEGEEEDCHADFNWEAGDNGLVIHFHSTSTSEHDIISYQWNFGDGHEGEGPNPNHTYEEPGVYLVCLRIEDNTGCVSEICHEVTVGEEEEDCHADFNWEHGDNELVIYFHSTSTSQHDIISYQWNFGDGHEGEGPNPHHTYEEPGVYLVCLRIEDNTGCVSEICHEVIVGEEEEDCHADFNWEHGDNELVIYFHSTSTSQHDIISYQWNFGDGHEGEGPNPEHVYEEPGTYLVCLRIEDNTGCVSEICHEVTVGEEEEDCHADFNWEAGDNENVIHFHSTSTSQHDIISYQWNFGDGHEAEGPNPNHTYEEPGVYVVCLRIEDNTGCVSEICHEVTVGGENEECNAAFSFDISDEGVVFFYNNSTGTGPHTTWLWTFGDGHSSTEENPHHTYEEPGFYTVCLTITDTTTECSSDVCEEIPFQVSLPEPIYFPVRDFAHVPENSTSSLREELNILKYTNPADNEVWIEFEVSASTTVSITLYDLTGNRLLTDFSTFITTGKQQRKLDISEIHSGLYILSVTTGSERKTFGLTISK